MAMYLVDYENINFIDLELIVATQAEIIVFIGERQTKLPVELVLNMQSLGNKASYIQIS